MKIAPIVAIGLIAGLLAGCTEDPRMTMQFRDRDEALLIGQLTMHDVNYINTVYFDYKVSDGSLTCSGRTPVVSMNITSGGAIKINTDMTIECDNGKSGTLASNFTFYGATWNGVGVGTLNDGTKVRVVVGDMIGNLNW